MAKFNDAQFNAGKETALADAKRGTVREPHKRDAKSWAAGYMAACDEFANTYGPNWRQKMAT